MNVVRIITHIGILYGFYALGTWIQQMFDLLIPGSIIGMLLLLLCFSLKVISPRHMEQGTSFLLAHLPLLFLPVTTGVILYFDIFLGSGLWLVIATLLSTMFVLWSAGWVSQWCIRKKEERREKEAA